MNGGRMTNTSIFQNSRISPRLLSPGGFAQAENGFAFGGAKPASSVRSAARLAGFVAQDLHAGRPIRVKVHAPSRQATETTHPSQQWTTRL
jgi:hypothetical protein